MCLLKPGQPNIQCNHLECKNFYLLNKQMCLHNIVPNSQNLSLGQEQSESSPNDGRTQNSLISTNKPSAFSSKVIVPATKRSGGTRSDISTDEEAELTINKKKVKPEGATAQSEGTTVPLGAFIQAQNNPNFSILNQTLLANTLANNLANNKLIQNQQRGDGLMGNNQVLYSVIQNPNLQNLQNLQNIQNIQNIQNLQNLQNQSLLQNLPLGFNLNSLQSLAQTPQSASTKAESIIQNQVKNVNENKATTSDSFEEFLAEFQTKTLTFLCNQNKLLCELNEKNELVQDTLACLINEISALKGTVNNTTQDTKSQALTTSNNNSKTTTHQAIVSASESITSDDLLAFLYGDKTDFEYQIVLNYELALPLYRERNFEFTVNLIDKDGNLVENSNKIPLTLSIYTCENPPKYIDSNTAGNKIFKGFTEKDLLKGSAGFDKIQIKEVTSHFRGGWIFLIVHPKINPSASSNVFAGRDGVFVKPEKIKPLVLEKVIVKAKKTKEREDGAP